MFIAASNLWFNICRQNTQLVEKKNIFFCRSVVRFQKLFMEFYDYGIKNWFNDQHNNILYPKKKYSKEVDFDEFKIKIL